MRILNVVVLTLISASAVTAKKCSRPGIPRNGIIIPEEKEVYIPGSEIIYDCKNSSYAISGNKTRICLDNGSWTDLPPFCLKRYSLEDSEISSEPLQRHCYGKDACCQNFTVRISNDENVKSIFIRLEKGMGKKLSAVVIPSGVEEIECKKINISDGLIPYECADYVSHKTDAIIQIIKKIKNCNFNVTELHVHTKSSYDCGTPDVPLNGDIKINETIAKFECKEGYTLSGDANKTCRRDGTWSGSPLYCIDAVVMMDTLLENYDWSNIQHNDVYEIEKKLQMLILGSVSLPKSILPPLTNLTNKLLTVSETMFMDCGTGIPSCLEMILSKIDLGNESEIREKMTNIEMIIWNIKTQGIPLICGTRNFSDKSLILESSSQCPNYTSEFSVRLLGNFTEGNAFLSIFKLHSIFPSQNFSYQYVIQVKLSGNLQQQNISTPLIEIQFKKRSSLERGTCSYLDMSVSAGKRGEWSTEGCWISWEDDTHVYCQCSHFTYFAALFHAPVPTSLVKVLQFTTTIGISLSTVCLFFTFFTYIIIPKLRTRTNHILFHLCTAMLLMDILFVANIERTENNIKCYFTSFTLHVSILATFSWLLVLTIVVAISLWKGTSAVSIIDKYWTVASTSSWLIPIIIAIITAAVDHSIYTSNPDVCWITEEGFIHAFLPFYFILTSVNCLLWLAIFVKVAYFLNLKSSNPDVVKKLSTQICMSFLLFVFTNLMWILGIWAYIKQSSVLSFLFCIVAPVQGMFIFLFYVVMDSKGKLVWFTIMGLFKLQCCMKSPRKGSSTTQETPLTYETGSRIT